MLTRCRRSGAMALRPTTADQTWEKIQTAQQGGDFRPEMADRAVHQKDAAATEDVADVEAGLGLAEHGPQLGPQQEGADPAEQRGRRHRLHGRAPLLELLPEWRERNRIVHLANDAATEAGIGQQQRQGGQGHARYPGQGVQGRSGDVGGPGSEGGAIEATEDGQ